MISKIISIYLWKRPYVFRSDLNFSRNDALLIFVGNLFHKVGAATLNVQSRYVLSRDTSTCNSIWMDDLIYRYHNLSWDNTSLLHYNRHLHGLSDNDFAYIPLIPGDRFAPIINYLSWSPITKQIIYTKSQTLISGTKGLKLYPLSSVWS